MPDAEADALPGVAVAMDAPVAVPAVPPVLDRVTEDVSVQAGLRVLRAQIPVPRIVAPTAVETAAEDVEAVAPGAVDAVEDAAVDAVTDAEEDVLADALVAAPVPAVAAEKTVPADAQGSAILLAPVAVIASVTDAERTVRAGAIRLARARVPVAPAAVRLAQTAATHPAHQTAEATALADAVQAAPAVPVDAVLLAAQIVRATASAHARLNAMALRQAERNLKGVNYENRYHYR